MAGRGYGISDYGQSLYGETKYLDGVATVSASASLSSTCNRVQFSGGSLSAASSLSADSVFVIDGAANDVEAVTTTASAAVEVFDGMAYGGATTVDSTASGNRVQNASATSSASASITASLQFIALGNASISASATTSSDCERVRFGAAESAPEASFSASANFTAAGSGTSTGSSVVSISYIRERSVAVQTIQTVSAFASVDGREKWEPISYTPVTWSEIAA